MISQYRKLFNEQFTQAKYDALLSDIEKTYKHAPKFKVCETPIFVPKLLRERLLEACKSIMDVIEQPNFKTLTENAFANPEWIVPNEDDKPKFVQFDFGICVDDKGNPIPKLIEMQGFPSLYFFQDALYHMYRKHYSISKHLSIYFNGHNSESFIDLLRQEIVGNTNPEQVVLLEIEPEKQATAIDFYCTQKALGIKILCISKLIKKGKSLFYVNDAGNEVQILKIYNRIIFDELYQRPDLQRSFNFTDEVDVEWIGHPNWFYRISKYTMPLLSGPFVPNCFYLDKLEKLPTDLENYVLKPLYSFAGAGVEIHVTPEMIVGIEDKSNYLLQEKVSYAPIIETMDVPAKCEIRMMLLHNSKTNKTEVVSNLVRLSKGEMIGVKYNKDKTWVGGSTGFFEP
ncbi:MAG TPA: hypothetical protein VKZ97_09390 [Flavobacteriaceae bacterium]|nr:hypothetical protein [Flavobacteriaceae bacterium]